MSSGTSNRMIIWIIAAAVLGLCLIGGGPVVGLWCIFTKAVQLAADSHEYVQAASGVSAPTGQLVLDQRLEFADGETTMQGSSFLARTPGGSVVIVTATHFLDFQGPALLRLEVFGESVVASAIAAFGPPGTTQESSIANIDRDFLLLVPESEPVGTAVLGFDERQMPRVGEKVWLPCTVGWTKRKSVLITGVVADVTRTYVMIIFDEGQRIELIGTSGSPVISQTNGNVIGIVSRGGEVDGDTFAMLTPAPGILKAMREAERSGKRPRLRDCVGKDGGK